MSTIEHSYGDDWILIESNYPEIEDDCLVFKSDENFHIQITEHSCGKCVIYSVVEHIPTKYTSENGQEYEYKYWLETDDFNEAADVVFREYDAKREDAIENPDSPKYTDN